MFFQRHCRLLFLRNRSLATAALLLCTAFLTSLQPAHAELATDQTEQALETASERKKRLADYYIVDLIVFEHRENFAINPANQENWPLPKAVYMPAERSYLQNMTIDQVYPELAADFAQLSASSNADSQTISLANTPFEVYQGVNSLPLVHRTFSALNQQRRKIQGASRYGLLSSYTWLQKLGGDANNAEIILPANIQRSDSVGRFLPSRGDIAVSGSIQLSKSRYLHIKTNLYITELTRTDVNIDGGQASLGNSAINLKEGDEHALYFLQAKFEPDFKRYQASKATAANDTQATPIGFWPANHSLPDFALPLSATNSVSVMQQKRRMRSSETHYLDHPKMGLIVQLTPLYLALDRQLDPGL